MGNYNDILLILGSLRYKSAPNTDFGLKVPFVQSAKNYIEFDRVANINQQQVFYDERQKSTFFRPVSKLVLLFKNSYSGVTNYTPYINSLYYTNAEVSSAISCTGGTPTWEGFPQYHEFEFIRTDFESIGYTKPPDNHLLFQPKEQGRYNWNFYMSYGFDNDYTKNMTAKIVIPEIVGSIDVSWVVSDGIPFATKLKVVGGLRTIQLWCPIKHGMNLNEFVKFNSPFTIGGYDILQISSLGNETTGSEEYVINIIDDGFFGLSDGQTGTFKRVILDSNLIETTSEYYVRRHKILTETNSAVIANAGYERNIFSKVSKFDKAVLTSNNVARTSVKEDGQTYTLSFNSDLDLINLVDNQKLPITKLYFTVIWKGFFGWTKSLKQGWEFNLPKDPSTDLPTTWWSDNNSDSDTTLSTTTYNVPPPLGVDSLGVPYNFIYTNDLNLGDVVDGDICEWNNYEQIEKELSTFYHKLRFNEYNFNISPEPTSNPLGYYYQPHHSVNIAYFSDYLEEGDPTNTVNIPEWAHFSKQKNLFVWRDKYPYGYIDPQGIGVDFPFMNGKHHPYRDIIFRIIPEGTNYKEYTNNNAVTNNMITDECE